jgi:hypothetical protein
MNDTHTAHAEPHTVPHEAPDRDGVDFGAVLSFAGGLAISALVIYVLIWLMFRFLADQNVTRTAPEFPMAAGQGQRLPPEPRLQTNPRQDLRDLRDAEDTVLTTYGWTDKNAGAVRIPIDEAMKLTVQRGLPARQDTRK